METERRLKVHVAKWIRKTTYPGEPAYSVLRRWSGKLAKMRLAYGRTAAAAPITEFREKYPLDEERFKTLPGKERGDLGTGHPSAPVPVPPPRPPKPLVSLGLSKYVFQCSCGTRWEYGAPGKHETFRVRLLAAVGALKRALFHGRHRCRQMLPKWVIVGPHLRPFGETPDTGPDRIKSIRGMLEEETRPLKTKRGIAGKLPVPLRIRSQLPPDVIGIITLDDAGVKRLTWLSTGESQIL